MFSHFFQFILEPQILISTLGTLGVILIVFLETGVFIGFFLPGDSLLFTAGLLASQGHLPIVWLVVGTTIAAILGDSVGYSIGKKIGPALFSRENSIFFNKEHITRAQHFYEKHGRKTIILARFIPIVRTFAPVVAGVGRMQYRTFLTFNVIGGVIWAAGVSLLGYVFGSAIPNPDRYILPAIIIIVLLSAGPALKEIIVQGIKALKK